MSIMAGAVALGAAGLREDVVTALRGAMSRHPGDVPAEHRTASAYVVKLDLGIWGSPGLSVRANGSVAALVGEPLLRCSEDNRACELSLLHDAWDRGDWSVLDRARGTFCAAHWNEPRRSLTLVSDKLGARPLYYCLAGETVVFATALRILEAVRSIEKTMDLRGVTEQITFGAPLGPRTPYANVAVLQSGELAEFRGDGPRVRRYWRWDRVVAGAKEPPSLRQLYDLFLDAVRMRLRGDRSVAAFLSGGLDSRCSVSALRTVGIDVATFNFYLLPGTQDQVLAELAAEALGTRHFSIRHDRPGVPPTALMDLAARRGDLSDRPGLVWSGDGGSVGTGLVYVDEDIVAAARAGNWHGAVDMFLQRHGSKPVPRLLQRSLVDVIGRMPYEGVAGELERLEDVEPGRRFHLFLMGNDQRRHLAYFFEDTDLHRLELQLPFFDADFLTAVLSAPLDDCVCHRLYHRWLAEFPAAARSVPWQTYPRHEPCPLPLPPQLRSQFDTSTFQMVWKARRPANLAVLREVMRARDFPAPILRRSVLAIYELAYRLRVSDYGYVAATAGAYYRYWSATAGRCTLPPSGGRSI